MPPKKKGKSETEKIAATEWQWLDGDNVSGTWKSFDDGDSTLIEQAFQTNPQSPFTTSGMSFSIGSATAYDFVNNTQTNTTTGTVRSIRRLSWPVSWEYLDDYGMFIAFYDEDNAHIEKIWRSMPPIGGSFVTTALSWNKGYNSKYTFSFSKDAQTQEDVGAQKNEDSGNIRKLRRVVPKPKVEASLQSWGIASASAQQAMVDATASVPAAPTPTVEVGTPSSEAPVPAAPTNEAPAVPAADSSPSASPVKLVVAPTTAISSSVFDPPVTWAPQSQPYELFDVIEGSKEYLSVIEPFLKTLKNKAKIHSVKRIQNLPLWKFYALTRHKVALRNAGNPTEMNLFHGARARENMDAIMQFGFDMRVARDGSAGIGIYFAVHASYSNGGYVLQNPDKSKEMFVCRVTVGSCVQGKHGLKRPPPLKPGSKELHDSVHNNKDVMFIVFDNFQAYPEYLIKYTNLTGW